MYSFLSKRLIAPLSKFSLFIVSVTVSLFIHSATFANSDVVAFQTDISTVNDTQRSGPDAIGGIGDWFFSNGTLCAIISDVDHEGQLSPKGGSLRDLGFCGRADEYFLETGDLVDGSQGKRFDAQSVSVVNGNEVHVVSAYDNAEMTVRYYFDAASPTELKIEKRYRLLDDSDSFNLISPLHFNYRALEPFVFSSTHINRSNGFQQEDFVSRGVSAMTVAARPADTIITITPPSVEAPISYGWRLESAQRVNADGEQYALPHFVLADNESTAMLVLSDSFYIGDGSSVGWIQLLQVPLLSLGLGDSLILNESIYVSKRGDVAGITDQLFKANTTQTVYAVTAKALEREIAVHVELADGTPVTHVIPNSAGELNFLLPSGDYQVRTLGLGDRSTTTSFSVQKEALNLGTLELPSIAQVSLPQGEAMRLIFLGLGDTPNPSFNDHLTQASTMEADGLTTLHRNNHVFLAGLDDDRKDVLLPVGQYEVLATKGPEHSITRTTLNVADAKNVTLDIDVPVRQVNSIGYISSDLHVHSGTSFDNTFSDQERVRSFAAEHAEVMVSSEHDLPTDFNPIIARMGLADSMVSIPASEVTSLLPTKRLPYTSGHVNFFPYPPEPLEFARGMVNHEDKRMREIIAHVREKHPEALVQLNHPRNDLTLSGELPNDYEDHINKGEFLEHMGVAGHPYQPDLPIDSRPNNTLIEADPETGLRDIDFDILEVINPGHENYQVRLDAVRKDWLSFLKQGFKIVGVANSDSHGYHEQVGVPRTMVAMTDDSIAGFDLDEFVGTLKQGDAYGSNGPLLEVSVNGQKMGSTITGKTGKLDVTVMSTDWIPVAEMLVQINGETVETLALDNTLRVQKLSTTLSFEKDSFVTIEVKGPVTEDYRKVYDHISPYAFSNPIFVDADSDGNWMAPGL